MTMPETLDVVCVGSATEDVFVELPDAKIIRLEDRQEDLAYLALEYGAKIRVDDLLTDTGGGATNTAATFSTMGLRTAVVTKVGEDTSGDRVLQGMENLGVATFGIARTTEDRTGYSIILTGFTGDRTILVHRGAAAHLLDSDVDWDLIKQTSWVYMNSLAEDSAPLFFKVAEFCGEHGINLAINPGREQRQCGIDGLKPALEHTTLIVVNRSEAYEITGVEPDRGPDDEKEMLGMLRDAGCRNAIITYGGKGSEGMDDTGHFKLPAAEGNPVSTVGAGDAFAAGTTVGLHRGLSLRDAMRVGSVNAASVVRQVGAKKGILSWEEALTACEDFA